MTKKVANRAWLRARQTDVAVRMRQQEGYRARSAFKLLELIKLGKLPIKQPAPVVIDLGAAPGAWSQVALRSWSKCKLLCLDILPMQPLSGVKILQGDFRSHQVQEQLAALCPKEADLIMSDISPNLTGNKLTDQANMQEIWEGLIDFAQINLSDSGILVGKIFTGELEQQIFAQLQQMFGRVERHYSSYSPKSSAELYLLGKDKVSCK